MTAWRIWYADGSTVSSGDCAPERVPRRGVVAIAQPDRTPGAGNVGYVVPSGADYYGWRTDTCEWTSHDRDGYDDINFGPYEEPYTRWCRGYWVPKKRYHEILEEAKTWAATAGLPKKSGFRPGREERAR